jgi:hypothetical protein
MLVPLHVVTGSLAVSCDTHLCVARAPLGENLPLGPPPAGEATTGAPDLASTFPALRILLGISFVFILGPFPIFRGLRLRDRMA